MYDLVGLEREGVCDDSGLRFFDAVDFDGLVFDGEVFVDDADAAFLCYCDCEACFGDGVHAGADEWDVESDVACELGGEIDVTGEDIGLCWLEQYVVERESFGYHFFGAHRSSQLGRKEK